MGNWQKKLWHYYLRAEYRAFKRSIQETFCMALHQIHAKLSKSWKCYTKDNWLASILATWGLGPQSSSSPFTPGLQSSPPRKGNWSTWRFGKSYLEFGSWNWPACGLPRSQTNPGIFHMSRLPKIWNICVFSVKINISTTGGFRVGFFQPDTNHP